MNVIPAQLDAYAVQDLRVTLLQYLRVSDEPAIDLSRVETCDAAGVQLLFSARRSAQEAGRRLKFVHPSAAVLAACESLGMTPEGLLGGD